MSKVGKETRIETRKSNTLKELWGVKSSTGWWTDGSGVLFHTPHQSVAKLQAEIVRSRGLADARVEQIQ